MSLDNFHLSDIILFSSVVFLIGLSGYILFRRDLRKPRGAFAGFLFFLGIWVLLNLLIDWSVTSRLASFLGKMTIIASSLLVAFFLKFSIDFPKPTQKNNLIKIVVFGPALIFCILAFSNLIVMGADVTQYPVEILHGDSLLLFGIFLLIYSLSGVLLFFWKFIHSEGVYRLQLGYICFGAAISFCIGLATNLFLPLFGLSSQYTRIGPLATIFFVVCAYYAIIRHRLMDIRIVLKRTSIYVAIFMTVLLFGGLISLARNTYFSGVLNQTWWGICMVVLGAALFEPLRKFYVFLSDKYFFQSLENSRQALKKLANDLAISLDISNIADSVVRTIVDTLGIEKIGILLNSPVNGFKEVKNVGFRRRDLMNLAETKNLREFLRSRRAPLLRQEIDFVSEGDEKELEKIESIKELLDKNNVVVVLPLTQERKMIGLILLGKKINIRAFSNEEISILEVISQQASVAIEHALMYEKIKDKCAVSI